MRSAVWLALLLTACSPGASNAPAASDSDNTIDCAINGATTFSHDCEVERAQQEGATILVVHHPDGGFRRFKILDGGQSLAAADGADALAIAKSADRVDVSVDGDRYRFPVVSLSDAGH